VDHRLIPCDERVDLLLEGVGSSVGGIKACRLPDAVEDWWCGLPAEARRQKKIRLSVEVLRELAGRDTVVCRGKASDLVAILRAPSMSEKLSRRPRLPFANVLDRDDLLLSSPPEVGKTRPGASSNAHGPDPTASRRRIMRVREPSIPRGCCLVRLAIR